MGTTFVSITESASPREIGFWMQDSVLQLWLRLLALHIPEPAADHETSYRIRNQWLLASHGHFTGCVPHDLHDAVAMPGGRAIVLAAIDSLMSRMEAAPPSLGAGPLNLLGIEGVFLVDFETRRLIEVGVAFRALIAGTLTCRIESTEFMPGSN